MAVFDPDSPKWRTCCCHVVSFVKVISWINVVLTALVLVVSFVYVGLAAHQQGFKGFLIALIFPIIIILCLVLAICPLIAIKKTIPWLIWPMIISYVSFFEIFIFSA